MLYSAVPARMPAGQEPGQKWYVCRGSPTCDIAAPHHANGHALLTAHVAWLGSSHIGGQERFLLLPTSPPAPACNKSGSWLSTPADHGPEARHQPHLPPL